MNENNLISQISHKYTIEQNHKVWFSKEIGIQNFAYSDGNEQEKYLEIYLQKVQDLSSTSLELQRLIRDWSSEYHLSPKRSNLLRPLLVDKFESVLELGAGCGAITRYLGENLKEVLSIEGSFNRAKIASLRCRDLGNVNVICTNFQNLEIDYKFDLVTLIGVLEYSGKYIENEDPYLECLKMAKSHLKKDGCLILAIENKLGLKYFLGCSEDHTGIHFDGLEGYSSGSLFRTFGKKELEILLKNAGFEFIEFLFPFPDYKIPDSILVERNYLKYQNIQEKKEPFIYQWLGENNSRDYSNRKIDYNIQELLIMKQLEANGLLADMSNSFLVVVSNHKNSINKLIPDDLVVEKYNTTKRKPKYLNKVSLKLKDNQLYVRRDLIYTNLSLENTVENPLMEHICSYKEQFIQGTNLIEYIILALKTNNSDKIEQFKYYLKIWYNFLIEHTDYHDDKNKIKNLKLEGIFFDCVPWNLIIKNNGKIEYIDKEWNVKKPIELQYILFRGIYHLLSRYYDLLKSSFNFQEIDEIKFIIFCFQLLSINISREQVEQYIQQEYILLNVLTEEKDKSMEKDKSVVLNNTKYNVIFSIILPVYNPKEKYLREAIASVINQTYPHWELCIADDASTKPYVREILTEYAYKDNRIKVVFRQENGHISKASNTALEIATGEYIALLDHDDILAPNALYEVAKLLNEHPEADMIYTDEALLNDQYICKEMFCKPDWCPDSFLSHMYTCHLGVYRRSLIQEIGGFRVGYEGSQDYDLVLRLTEKTDKIFHIPKLLYYWRQHSGSVASGNYQVKPYAYKAAQKALEDALKRRKEKGIVIPHENYPGTYKTRYEIIDYDLVSIIIPTRDLADILDRCLESIFNKTTYPKYEIILLDNGSKENETFAVFDKWKKQQPDKFYCYRYDVPFNYSHINNYAVTKAKGKYLLFLNNDTEVITPDWINAMVEQAQRQSIGAVGAYLKYPDNTMQHTGVVLGRGPLAGHEYIYHDKILNFSAVTGACLMCRRDVFVEVGGFDENLAAAFNDVDLCLKIREQGYYNICLPHVLLYHHESKTRGYEDTPEKIARFEREVQFMRDKWGELVEKDQCTSFVYVNNPRKDKQVSANFTIIVPWWDHTEFLELWQNNLKILKDAEIIFIDNGSQEESKKALAEFCQKHSLKLIRNEENLGFSATNNQGLKKATKEYILHLNNDISINYLPFVYLAYLAENGIVGPGPAKNELNVSYVEGWGLCAKKSVLENLGGWDEEFDDQDWAILDLCHRAKLAGYPSFSIPKMRKWFLPVS